MGGQPHSRLLLRKTPSLGGSHKCAHCLCAGFIWKTDTQIQLQSLLGWDSVSQILQAKRDTCSFMPMALLPAPVPFVPHARNHLRSKHRDLGHTGANPALLGTFWCPDAHPSLTLLTASVAMASTAAPLTPSTSLALASSTSNTLPSPSRTLPSPPLSCRLPRCCQNAAMVTLQRTGVSPRAGGPGTPGQAQPQGLGNKGFRCSAFLRDKGSRRRRDGWVRPGGKGHPRERHTGEGHTGGGTHRGRKGQPGEGTDTPGKGHPLLTQPYRKASRGTAGREPPDPTDRGQAAPGLAPGPARARRCPPARAPAPHSPRAPGAASANGDAGSAAPPTCARK